MKITRILDGSLALADGLVSHSFRASTNTIAGPLPVSAFEVVPSGRDTIALEVFLHSTEYILVSVLRRRRIRPVLNRFHVVIDVLQLAHNLVHEGANRGGRVGYLITDDDKRFVNSVRP